MREGLELFFKKHLPSFKSLTDYERLSGGASQETYKIIVETLEGEQQFAFRRAVGGISRFAKLTLTQEAQLMRIAGMHKIPEPEVLAICNQGEKVGEGFMMTWVEGETFGKRIVKSGVFEKIRPKLAFQCGEILARIHAIPLKTLDIVALATQTPKEAIDESYHAYQDFMVPRPMIDYTARWLYDHLPSVASFTLTHNDFRNGNLIVAPDDGICAVLDWELAIISDPMRDLGWLCANCWRFGSSLPVGGFGTYADLIAGYQSVGGEVDRARMRFWEVFASFRWAIICMGMGAAWQSGVDRSIERAAIGRRVSEGELDCANLVIERKREVFIPPVEEQESGNLDMPSHNELLQALRDHLLAGRKDTDSARDRFMALVSTNVIDLVLRQYRLGDHYEALEKKVLDDILGVDTAATLAKKRWQLIGKIHKQEIALDDSKLMHYLRSQTIRQLMIDQPKYSGIKTALEII